MHNYSFALCRAKISKQQQRSVELKEATNPTYETIPFRPFKANQTSDNGSRQANTIIKADSSVHTTKQSDELFYHVAQVGPDKKSNNKDDIRMNDNPSYCVKGGTEKRKNLRKVKEVTKPTHDSVQISTKMNQGSTVRSYGANDAMNDDM